MKFTNFTDKLCTRMKFCTRRLWAKEILVGLAGVLATALKGKEGLKK